MNERQLFIQIGDKIKEIRIQKGITQLDLAAKCNFEKSNMSRIESDITNTTVKTLFAISVALEVKIWELEYVVSQLD